MASLNNIFWNYSDTKLGSTWTASLLIAWVLQLCWCVNFCINFSSDKVSTKLFSNQKTWSSKRFPNHHRDVQYSSLHFQSPQPWNWLRTILKQFDRKRLIVCCHFRIDIRTYIDRLAGRTRLPDWSFLEIYWQSSCFRRSNPTCIRNVLWIRMGYKLVLIFNIANIFRIYSVFRCSNL